MRRRNVIIFLGVVLALVIVGASGFAIYVGDYARPMPEAVSSLQTDEFVQFSNPNGWLVFQPVSQSDLARPPSTGLIIYPGGKVDSRAYAPTARAIAAHGYLVVIPPMPFNLALLDPNAAGSVIHAYPQVQHWAVAGHSLGGVAVSMYAAGHPEQIQGIVFWASYPSGNMTGFPGRVVSISASNDGLATPAKITESKANLPASALYVEIAGGNHGQFGYYGAQSGDGAATIDRDAQQRAIVAATVELLAALQ